jgi:hypothetical protein
MASAERANNGRHLPGGFQSSSQAYEALIDFKMHAVSGGAWKALSYIARRTIGFAKDADAISLTQICDGITTRDGRRLDYGTGLSRSAAVRALGELEAKGYVSIDRGGGAEVNNYRLKLDSARCQNDASVKSELVAKRDHVKSELVAKRDHPVVAKRDHPVVAKRYSQEAVLQEAVLQPTEERKAVPIGIPPPGCSLLRRNRRKGWRE